MSETAAADIAALLARGGWDLGDAQARHRANPDSFWLPPDEELARIAPGSQVRLIFRLLDQADLVRDGVEPYGPTGAPNLTIQFERMWLWVERLDGEALVGILDNLPMATHARLAPGARVRFRRRDVIDLEPAPSTTMEDELKVMASLGFHVLGEQAVLAPEDPHRAPSIAPSQQEACARAGVRPERPWLFSRALVGKGVQPGRFPIRGGRFRPNPDKGDCGWVLFSEGPDMETAAKQEGFELVEIGQLHGRHREAWSHLALPPGWAFVLGPDGYEDVYRDPGLLE